MALLGNRQDRMLKIADKLSMYDMILANLIAGKAIIEPDQHLDSSHIDIGFSNISSETQIIKYFVIRQFPDYLQSNLFGTMRNRCIRNGVKINFYTYASPYKINWDSDEMRNKMSIWRRYSAETSNTSSVFDYRTKRKDIIAKERIIKSTKYLNTAELEYRRSLMKVSFVIEISANRDDESILNMGNSIRSLIELCDQLDIKVRELRVNMIDWLQVTGIFSLKEVKDVSNKISKKILTDDILANFNGYKQGRVGKYGIPLGIDVLAGVPVMRKFKADPDAPENWVIAAETGGGKSYFVKELVTYLMADGFVVTVMDYEGDEYSNLASYIRAGNSEDVQVISMGKGSTVYFDPMEIPELTGDSDIDCDLKETAVNYTLSIFRLIVGGLSGNLGQLEERIISTAIQRVYDSAEVTDNIDTWKNSKGLRLSMVYDEIKNMVDRKEYVDSESDNVRHKAALRIADAAYIYFEEGESKSGTFKHPMSANELYKAKFIVFSFGMKGAGSSTIDPVILALKQLSVACISTQISNYCKYVKHCFNAKVWEEFQRWGDAKGSSEIINNAMTGGRKRGDANFILTNKIDALLDESNPVTAGIRLNVQNWAVGRINDSDVRHKFCMKFDLQDCEAALTKIAKSYPSYEDNDRKSDDGYENKYKHSFCVILDNGKKAITKVMLPQSIRNSKLLTAGVDVH